MVSLRAKRLFLFLTILLLTFTVAVLPCKADDYPDISNLDRSCYLSDNLQFFNRPGGFVLVSTDSVKETLFALLDKDGNPDSDVLVNQYNVSFPYVKAALSGNYLYIVGKSPKQEDCIKISRFNITNGTLVTNDIEEVSCDFTRGFIVDSNGNFSLVTVPFGNELNTNSPVWVYAFDPEHEGAHCVGSPSSHDSSSSSETESSEPSPSSSDSSSNASSGTTSSSPPDSSEAPFYLFSTPVTVESLQKQLDSEGHGAQVCVTAWNGSSVKSGSVGTGSIIEVISGTQVESRVTAIIPGDLIGTGVVTEQDSNLLYQHVANQEELTEPFLKAADLNGDGKIDTSDLLQIKKLAK